MAQLRANHPTRIAREAEKAKIAADQAEAALIKDIQQRCWDLGADLNSIPHYFAEKIGVCEQTGRSYLKAPGKIQMDTMRRVVQKISPDIRVMLRFLGYSDKEINKFAKEAAQ